MCRPASFVLTKERAFWSENSDSHEDIIREHELHADGVKGPNIVRVEIVPPHSDFSRSEDEWVFSIDQDILPQWAKTEDLEKRTRAVLSDWISCKVLSQGNIKVKSRQVYAYGSASVKAYGSASVEACDSASVEAYDSASVEAYGSASVYAYGSASVEACKGHATVRHYNTQSTTPDGPFAVMIDCTGSSAVCTNGN